MTGDSSIEFVEAAGHPLVSLCELLFLSYSPLFRDGTFTDDDMCGEWGDLDSLARSQPDCFFLTLCDSHIAGFGSVDPRGAPEGLIGHHVVLPGFRGKGIGSLQLQEMERRLISRGCDTAAAITGDIEFFLPARQLYERSGYLMISHYSGRYFPVVRYEKSLSGGPV